MYCENKCIKSIKYLIKERLHDHCYNHHHHLVLEIDVLQAQAVDIQSVCHCLLLTQLKYLLHVFECLLLCQLFYTHSHFH